MLDRGTFRLSVQYLAALAALGLAFHFGVLRGTLAPLIHLDGWGQPLLLPVVAVVYLLVLLPLGLIESDPSRGNEAAGWEQVTVPELAGAVAGALIGGGLVFGIPDWLSTVLPLVALSAGALAFAFAGDAVPVEGLDTVLWSVAATIHLFVVPVVLSLFIGGIAHVVATSIAMVSLLVVRGWLGEHSPIDQRISVSLAIVFALVAGGVMAHDLSGPRPATDLDTEATVNLSAAEDRLYAISDGATERPMVRIGTLTVTNGFAFARTGTLPEYRVCLYGPNGTRPSAWGPSASPVETDGTVSPVDEIRFDGGERRQFSIVVLLDHVEGRSATEARALGTVPVRRADSCPETTEGPALVLVPADEN